MFKFEENSIIVRTWVSLVTEKKYTRQQVPNLGNLREVVYSILDKELAE